MAEGPQYESIEIELVEDRVSEDRVSEDRMSIEELSGADLEFDDGTATLLTLTGEEWSIDAQRETLKEAARDKRSVERQPESPNAKPAVAVPTPFDFGGTSSDETPVILVEEDEPTATSSA